MTENERLRAAAQAALDEYDRLEWMAAHGWLEAEMHKLRCALEIDAAIAPGTESGPEIVAPTIADVTGGPWSGGGVSHATVIGMAGGGGILTDAGPTPGTNGKP